MGIIYNLNKEKQLIITNKQVLSITVIVISTLWLKCLLCLIVCKVYINPGATGTGNHMILEFTTERAFEDSISLADVSEGQPLRLLIRCPIGVELSPR
ncbi:unnamed protein product [Rodentolepis nana]|uniref:RRM domain-containing protein n=1 Tax=Rodentolepis nana TaxID=102285 RepID=A0A0R3T0I9_RODNA|nr:unnamed protein product [Rodentolepis nana]